MERPLSKTRTSKLVVLPQFAPLLYKKRGIIVGGGRSRGASTAMAQTVVYLCSKMKIRVAICREFLNSIDDSAKAEIEKWIASDPAIESEWIITRSYLMHKYTLSTIKFKGLQRNRTSIKGLSDIDLCIVEEADSMSWESWQLLSPTIRKKDSQVWLIGNNSKRSTVFGTLFQNPPPGWLKIFSTYLQNPYNTQDTLDKAAYDRKVLGESVYQNIWMGDWEDSSKMRMVNQIVVDDGSLGPEPDNAAVFIGVDVSRSGGDKCAIAVRRGRVFPELLSFPDMDLPTLTGILQTLIRKYQPTGVYIDSTGHGAWAPDALKANKVLVQSVVFNSRAHEEDKYADRKTEMYGRLGLAMQDQVCVPNDKELIEDLEHSLYDWDGRNRPKMRPKDDIKPLIGRSPDKGDAVALTFAHNGDLMTDPNRGMQAIVNSAHVNNMLMNMGRWK